MSHDESPPLVVTPFEEVLEQYRAGGMVIIADRSDRENEGDLVVATQLVTPEHVSFMQREARGLICVSISSEVGERLRLPLQVINNNSPFGTAFTVSVDHRSVAGSGVTAESRASTMRADVIIGANWRYFGVREERERIGQLHPVTLTEFAPIGDPNLVEQW